MAEWGEVFRQQMREVKTWHAWSLQRVENLEVCTLEYGWKKALQGRARASFMCSQCGHTWSSCQVVILFHMRWERPKRQGRVRMRVFRQQCRSCSSPEKEQPQFTREEMESVVQRLILDIREKCYREPVHRGELSEVVCEGGGPHKRESCEACQMGLHKGHHGKPDGALCHGKSVGALHHGKSDSTPDHGKSVGTLHHGKPGSTLYCGSSQSSRYPSSIPNLPSREVSPIHTSMQPAGPSAVSRSCRPCCSCCIVILVLVILAVIPVLVAYWEGWF